MNGGYRTALVICTYIDHTVFSSLRRATSLVPQSAAGPSVAAAQRFLQTTIIWKRVFVRTSGFRRQSDNVFGGSSCLEHHSKTYKNALECLHLTKRSLKILAKHFRANNQWWFNIVAFVYYASGIVDVFIVTEYFTRRSISIPPRIRATEIRKNELRNNFYFLQCIRVCRVRVYRVLSSRNNEKRM